MILTHIKLSNAKPHVFLQVQYHSIVQCTAITGACKKHQQNTPGFVQRMNFGKTTKGQQRFECTLLLHIYLQMLLRWNFGGPDPMKQISSPASISEQQGLSATH